jgi:hypothetical protein
MSSAAAENLLISPPQEDESPQGAGSLSGVRAPASADEGGIDAPF